VREAPVAAWHNNLVGETGPGPEQHTCRVCWWCSATTQAPIHNSNSVTQWWQARVAMSHMCHWRQAMSVAASIKLEGRAGPRATKLM
jgi:hypothetical protein